jgi:hypothetical protein
MAEHTSKPLNVKTQRRIDRVRERITQRWPGGVAGYKADFIGERCTFRQAFTKIGVEFRALESFHKAEGIPKRSAADANRIGHQLNPQWGERISQGKIRHSFKHPDHVVQIARDKRMKLFREHPERHGNAHALMTRREQAFSELLTECGIAHRFNVHGGGYWLDFHLLDYAVGIEVQKVGRVPKQQRDRRLCESLNLKTIVYLPNTYFGATQRNYLRSFVTSFVKWPDELASCIGDARHLVARPFVADVHWYGFGFKNRWTMQQVRTEPEIQSA